MKKLFVGMFLLILTFVLIKSNEMIRIRILANSNSEYDQNIKKEVVEIVKEEFKTILNNTSNIEDARNKISSNLNHVSSKVDSFLTKNKVDYKSKINFGFNYFPTKNYNGKTYDEGYYESVLITLGEGKGDNFWCILFPSVCLTDDDLQYDSFIKTIFKKIF